MKIADIWSAASNRPFQPVARPGAGIRLHELDGLRGWAALSVVMFHIFWEIFGVVIPWLRNPITGFLFDGDLAVAIFFILSGEALSSAYFAGRGDLAVVKLAIKRYTRLTIPVAATCLIIFILSKFNLIHNKESSLIVHRQDWLGQFLSIPATGVYYLKYAFIDVFNKVEPSRAVDPFLWTMQFEIIGSIIVFGILFTFKYLNRPWILLILIVLALQIRGGSSLLSCFLVGMVFSSARMSGVFVEIQKTKHAHLISWAAFIALASIDGLENCWGLGRARMAIIAAPIVLSIYCNKSISKFFANRLSVALGSLSFPLYLIQFPVFVSITSILILYFSKNIASSPPLDLSIGLFSLLVCLIFAFLFMPVESLTRWIGDRLVRLLLSDPK